MHELLLYAQIPPSRHNQLLRILSGIAGTQPQRVVERHLIFVPRKIHDSRGQQVGGTQTVQNQQAQALQGQLHGELFHLQLVSEIDDEQFPDEDGRTLEGLQRQGDEMMKDTGGGNIETRTQQGHLSPKEPLGGAVEGPSYDFDKQLWSLRFHDLPEVAGRRPVTSRMISSVDIIDGNAIEFMDALGYKLV
jgi:mediator of RNA polymerase II transcription subunit 18